MMSQFNKQEEKPLPFSWGVKKGSINIYESFTLEGIEYFLYDTVYFYRAGQVEPDIGKLVKLLEMENHEKKAEVVWFFRPAEIVNFLGGVRPLEREIFLACGEGTGLMKVNPLEAISGKCNVVCSSKDIRNPQPNEEELRMADYIFLRSFDVGTHIISDEFPSSIAGIEVAHYFNRRSFTTGGSMNTFINDRPQAGGNMKRSEHFLPVSSSPSDTGPTKKRKLLPPSLAKPSIPYKYTEVARRPGSKDAGKWLKLEVWTEGRLNEANEKGTLVVLDNLDPSFTSSEVEDIIWNFFDKNVKAKMVQCTAFSSPRSGQALVIFRTKEAADGVCCKLTTSCLVLGDGRPIVCRRRLPRKVGVGSKFVGYLSIDRTRSHRQREDIRNAVATSHFSQGNTVEFEMAIQWRALQEKSHRWWTTLHEEQGKEIEDLMKQMKIRCPE